MRFKDMDEERKKVDELTKAHQNLGLEGENYLIRPFQDMAEIEREGELLHHAIAYYAIDRYAKGKDYLFAMRKASEPDTPFISLEFSSAGTGGSSKGLQPQKSLTGKNWSLFSGSRKSFCGHSSLIARRASRLCCPRGFMMFRNTGECLEYLRS
mgnify:CR=1 FL=1